LTPKTHNKEKGREEENPTPTKTPPRADRTRQRRIEFGSMPLKALMKEKYSTE